MATITKPNTFSAGATIVAAEHNSNFDTIYNEFNGEITNANIKSTAAIADTKLATIDTASKVNLSALVITSQAAGDIIFASSATALTRLAAGTASNFLESAGTAAPVWASMSGHVLQKLSVQTGAVATGTVAMLDDDTVPASDEGDEFMTLSITPTGSANILFIESVVHLADSADTNLIAALFQDSTTAALATSKVSSSAANIMMAVSFTHAMTAATTASTTFKINGGAPGATTTTFNGESGSRQLGGAIASSITITEVKA